MYAYSPSSAGGTSSSGAVALGNATAHAVALRVAFNASQAAWFDGAEAFSSAVSDLGAIDADALNWAAAPVGSSGPFTIGAQSKAYQVEERYATLELAELLVYDAALSDAQVRRAARGLERARARALADDAPALFRARASLSPLSPLKRCTRSSSTSTSATRSRTGRGRAPLRRRCRAR